LLLLSLIVRLAFFDFREICHRGCQFAFLAHRAQEGMHLSNYSSPGVPQLNLLHYLKGFG